uniref:Uncharacterized protein n=1 Tax=Meloidogyne enterolobii TaxID=390850 RepID=A0A6V7VX63_MELEN|nr:unnamed protein product [Meloidogyne enterolobii]
MPQQDFNTFTYLSLENFVKIKNKWNIINYCCENKCVNKNKPTGNCIKGKGFANLTNDEDIKYINCLDGLGDNDEFVFFSSGNQFKNPKDAVKYSLFYFEIKLTIQFGMKIDLFFGLGTKDWPILMNISFLLNAFVHYQSQNKFKMIKLTPTFSFDNNDTFGCGLVYPPTNKSNEFPYVFYTQNGKQIGKALSLKGFNTDYYEPAIVQNSFSLETNFGNDLNSKPFKYDITKHAVLKEFYADSDVLEYSVNELPEISRLRAMLKGLSALYLKYRNP